MSPPFFGLEVAAFFVINDLMRRFGEGVNKATGERLIWINNRENVLVSPPLSCCGHWLLSPHRSHDLLCGRSGHFHAFNPPGGVGPTVEGALSALATRMTGNADLARGHHQEFTKLELISVVLQNRTELFDLDLETCSGEPKENDAGVG
jgi:hypothetical protein